jgi:GT2 family glycosyltransferase
MKRVDYPLQVVVIDSAPREFPARAVAERFGAGYLLEPRGGLSRARNLGAVACSADIVAYTDDDSLADVDWLRAMMGYFADPEVAIVTGRILPPPGGEPKDPLLARRGRSGPLGEEVRTLTRDTPDWFAAVAFGSAGDGANMAFRRAVFETWGGFDERFGRGAALNSGEEHLAFVDLLVRGYKLVYEPASVIYHPVAATRAELRMRLLQARRDATANFLYWIFERQEFRAAALRVITNGVWTRIRRAFARSTDGISQLVTFKDVSAAVVAGLGRYGRSLRRNQRLLTAAARARVAAEALESRRVQQQAAHVRPAVDFKTSPGGGP